LVVVASRTRVTDQHKSPVSRTARKASVGAAGLATIALGVVLIPLPGPGTLVILGGVSVLGKEFPAARRLADRGKGVLRRVIGSSESPHETG
jgi:hypothetical protein